MLLCSVPFVGTKALTLPEEEPVLVYYMPQTQLLLTAEYDEVVTEVGPFYQYSQRYLGTKDVVMKAEKQYVLQGVTVKPTAIADTSRAYVLQDKNVKLQLLLFSPIGTLAGYNIEPKAECGKPLADRTGHPCKDGKCESFVGTGMSQLMPLLEEQLMASSTAKMAEGAAKQIYRIREIRLNLLAGDVEKVVPADGKALQQILKELDKREQDLTALFIGRRNVTHHVHTLCYTPKAGAGAKDESILFRFSKYYGIVATDDLSGEPVNIRISKTAHQLIPAEKQSQKAVASIYHNIPGKGDLTITYGDRELAKQLIDVAQWGVSVPVNSALMLTMPRITFNPETGAIISIEK